MSLTMTIVDPQTQYELCSTTEDMPAIHYAETFAAYSADGDFLLKKGNITYHFVVKDHDLGRTVNGRLLDHWFYCDCICCTGGA